MSKKFYKPMTRSPNFVKVSNPTLVPSTSKSAKSRSYLSKLKEKQELLLRESHAISTQYLKGEELTEKPSIYSENSLSKFDVSFEQKPSILNQEDEEILNVIRFQQPKAEICSSSRLNSARNPSPVKNYMVSERCEEFEKDLKAQRTKYRKLEAQYNELLNKNAHIELFYSGIIQNLKTELESSKTEQQDPILEELSEDIIDVKSKILKINEKFARLEERLKKEG
jgi:hypothetical protein